MPPAIELLNYMTMKAVPLSRIFPQTGGSRRLFGGFSLHIIFFTERNSEAAMGRLRAGPVLRVNVLKKTGRAGA
jgi:hypothetical protein